MKHGTNSRRMRNRGNGKRHPALRNQALESNGPDGKIRGTAQQVLDRYLALARDATSAGDPIAAEGFFQHAEHYFRLMHGSDGHGGDRGFQRPRMTPADGEPFGEEETVTGGQPAVITEESGNRPF